MDLRVFVQTMITLASAALGLVAALAWNEAIKGSIKQVLGDANGLTGLYIYAIAATVLAIVVLSLLAKLASRIGGEAKIKREVD
jgi:cytochrome b